MFASNPAQAFTLSINPTNGSTENTGASALLDFNFVQDGSNVKLNLGIKNTTNGSLGLGATQATLVGVGFDLPSLVKSAFNYNTGYNAGTSAFTTLYQNAALNPYGTFDVGIRSAGPGNFAGGNPQQGLTAGQSATVSFLFSGTNLTASAVESAFKNGISNGSLDVVGRFQQVNAGGGSDKVIGGLLPESGGGNSAAVPEPTTMLGAIAAGGAFLGRKRLQRKKEA
jgi:hypothetical protein